MILFKANERGKSFNVHEKITETLTNKIEDYLGETPTINPVRKLTPVLWRGVILVLDWNMAEVDGPLQTRENS